MINKKSPAFKRSIFIDSSSFEQIKKWNQTGIIDGVTTNQLIMLKDGITPANYRKTVKKICSEMKNKPVSVELTDSSLTEKQMLLEAEKISDLAPNIVVKIPFLTDSNKSLNLIHSLTRLNIALNVTVMMTFEQLVLATLALRNSKKISFISLFWGRSIEDHERYRSKEEFSRKNPKLGPESDVNVHPREIIKNISNFINQSELNNVKTIVGSIRNASMVGEAISSGANIVTVTPDVLTAMLFSQRSAESNQEFDEAWKTLKSKK